MMIFALFTLTTYEAMFWSVDIGFDDSAELVQVKMWISAVSSCCPL